MIDAREIEYLRLAGLPNDEWEILIEVHYFRERDMSATGFHKDTLGETLFVNLNYAMDKKVIGPEYVVNPPPSPTHDEQLAASLPKGFRDDLAYTREKLGEPKEIGAKMVDPYGYVAFVDEAVHHATPHHWHRHATGGDLTKYLQTKYPAAFREAMAEYPKYANRGRMYYWSYFSSWVDPSIISAVDSSKWAAWMDVVTPILAADTLRQDLETKYPAEFKEASAAYKKYVNRGRLYYWSYFSAWVDPSIISAADSGKWLGWMEIIAAGDAKRNLNLTRVNLKASMTDDQFDEMLETVGAAGGTQRSKGGAAGFYSASIPKAGEHPVKPRGRPALKRRLSQPDFRKQLGPAPGENEKRRFFRTWVRVIPKAKADALRKALEG